MAAALSYLFTWVTGLIFYLTEDDNEYVRFHAMQSILLGVAYIIGYFVLSILFGILGTVLAFSGVFVGFRLMSTFFPLLSLAGLVLVAFMMYQAYQGEWFELPVIGGFAASKSSPSGSPQGQQPPGGPGGHGGQGQQYQQPGQGQQYQQPGQGTQYGGQGQPTGGGHGQPGRGQPGEGGQPGGGQQPGGRGRRGGGPSQGDHQGREEEPDQGGQPGQGGQGGRGRDSRSGQPGDRDDRRD